MQRVLPSLLLYPKYLELGPVCVRRLMASCCMNACCQRFLYKSIENLVLGVLPWSQQGTESQEGPARSPYYSLDSSFSKVMQNPSLLWGWWSSAIASTFSQCLSHYQSPAHSPIFRKKSSSWLRPLVHTFLLSLPQGMKMAYPLTHLIPQPPWLQ